MPFSVKCNGFTPFIPPAITNIAIRMPAQTVNIKYLIILSLFTFTFLLFMLRHASLSPAMGQIQPHHARPKKIAVTNININNSKLPDIMPIIAPSIETYGDKKFKVTGNNKRNIIIKVFLTFCLTFHSYFLNKFLFLRTKLYMQCIPFDQSQLLVKYRHD